MKQLNVQQLSALMQTRQTRRHHCFDKILEQCHTFIRRHADKNVVFCFYEVPDFMIGYPLYDLNECITYLVEKLRAGGFLVRYFFPRILYISWNINEIKEEKLKHDMTLIKALEGPSQPVARPKTPARGGRKGKVASVIPTTVPTKSVSFVKSVKEFKPSGKIVLDL